MKNVEATAKKTVVLNLQMSTKMALWLMEMVQNPIGDVALEDAESASMREELFTAINGAFRNA